IKFLRNPEAFGRLQPILGIFPAGAADRDFEAQMKKPWHTGAAVAACETGAAIVPFYIEGLPYQWGPFDMLKAASRSLVGRKASLYKIPRVPPIAPPPGESNYVKITERFRYAVLQLAG